MNSTIDTILSHRSIRAFTQEAVTKEQLDTIIRAGIAASSSSLLQVNSIIRVTDPVKREALVTFSGGKNMSVRRRNSWCFVLISNAMLN